MNRQKHRYIDTNRNASIDTPLSRQPFLAYVRDLHEIRNINMLYATNTPNAMLKKTTRILQSFHEISKMKQVNHRNVAITFHKTSNSPVATWSESARPELPTHRLKSTAETKGKRIQQRENERGEQTHRLMYNVFEQRRNPDPVMDLIGIVFKSFVMLHIQT